MQHFEEIAISDHARGRLAERNVQDADATCTISDPDEKKFQRNGMNGGKVYLHSKRIGTTKLFVVAEIVAKKALIVTVYWENDEEP